jgi:hypothetical protein
MLLAQYILPKFPFGSDCDHVLSKLIDGLIFSNENEG